MRPLKGHKGLDLPLLTVSTRTLNILAAVVWHVGGLVLLLKGGSLLAEADLLAPSRHWPWSAALAALLIGSIKARFLFNPSCRKNLARIAALDHPKIWQFFRPGFFGFLTLMIFAGAALSRLAHGNYGALIAVAVIDLSIATALLGSSYIFWQQKALSPSSN